MKRSLLLKDFPPVSEWNAGEVWQPSSKKSLEKRLGNLNSCRGLDPAAAQTFWVGRAELPAAGDAQEQREDLLGHVVFCPSPFCLLLTCADSDSHLRIPALAPQGWVLFAKMCFGKSS